MFWNAGRSTRPFTVLLLSILIIVFNGISNKAAQAIGSSVEAPPFQLVRSLQFVQDSVVAGDHSAMDLQRFLLEQIDQKLRAAPPEEFDDPRNVDAALIYVMSGGNPRTLDLIVARDKFGYFDQEVTSIMRAYLNGLVPQAKTPYKELIKIYERSPIGPYIALIAANIRAAEKDIKALEFFDLARLLSPGSILEESALRRSILLTLRQDQLEQALEYAHIYSRRFNRSPYSVQFSELITDMMINNFGQFDEHKVDEIISRLNPRQQRNIYLRLSYAGVITGNRIMANKAKNKVEILKELADEDYVNLAELYANVIGLPDEDVADRTEKIAAIMQRKLTRKDRVLYDAAQFISQQILHIPDPESLTQATQRNIMIEEKQAEEQRLSSANLMETLEQRDMNKKEEVELPDQAEFQEFMRARSSTLGDVDTLLAAEGDRS